MSNCNYFTVQTMKFLLIFLLAAIFAQEIILAHASFSIYNNTIQIKSKSKTVNNELYSIKNFSCNLQRASDQAYNVHHLKPSDIEVVAAIGDSITAGLFAKSSNLLNVFLSSKSKLEYRGISFSIGGDTNSTTLPNLLKKYNPSLKGYAVHSGSAGDEDSGYDFAISGATSFQLYRQTEKLISKLKDNNLNDEWKIITIMIGANNLCSVCKNPVKFSSENYFGHLKLSIDNLASNLTNTFINLLQIIDVYKINKLTTSHGCTAVQGFLSLFGICKCINDASISYYHQQYVQTIWDLETYYKGVFNDRDDFVVVVQPFLEDSSVPKTDPISYFAPDCFHLSQKGHTVAAISLWNNMIMPPIYKSTYFNVETTLQCPLKFAPYFYTHKTTDYLTKTTNNNSQEEFKFAFFAMKLFSVFLCIVFIIIVVIILLVLCILLGYSKRRSSPIKYYQL